MLLGYTMAWPFTLLGELMAKDCLFKVKLNDGTVAQVGDVGKSVVRDLGDITDVNDLEPNFFYARDYNGEEAFSLGEISNIQVEPSWSGAEPLENGDAVVFGTNDLLD